MNMKYLACLLHSCNSNSILSPVLQAKKMFVFYLYCSMAFIINRHTQIMTCVQHQFDALFWKDAQKHKTSCSTWFTHLRHILHPAAVTAVLILGACFYSSKVMSDMYNTVHYTWNIYLGRRSPRCPRSVGTHCTDASSWRSFLWRCGVLP